MIRGLHAMFYSSQADELRAFLRDKLGFKGMDVGDGWLIFDAPEADIGVHPTDGEEAASGTANISFQLPDFNGTVRLSAVAWSRRVSHGPATQPSRAPLQASPDEAAQRAAVTTRRCAAL